MRWGEVSGSGWTRPVGCTKPAGTLSAVAVPQPPSPSAKWLPAQRPLQQPPRLALVAERRLRKRRKAGHRELGARPSPMRVHRSMPVAGCLEEAEAVVLPPQVAARFSGTRRTAMGAPRRPVPRWRRGHRKARAQSGGRWRCCKMSVPCHRCLHRRFPCRPPKAAAVAAAVGGNCCCRFAGIITVPEVALEPLASGSIVPWTGGRPLGFAYSASSSALSSPPLRPSVGWPRPCTSPSLTAPACLRTRRRAQLKRSRSR
mmetsp:Transcript_137312/g.347865  ORF Transcript_137312/g.347865 Transcript_137312/m.347865 type:complete len:258 (-) Transcript_137312:323-1096(-)